MRYYSGNETHVVQVRRPGLGDVTSSITDAAVASMTPAIQQVLVNDVLPYMGIAIVAGAAIAAGIGVWFGGRVIRSHSVKARMNPVSRTHVGLSRRRR